MWDNLGHRLYVIIIRLGIKPSELPWVDGRLDVVELLRLYRKGKEIEDNNSYP